VGHAVHLVLCALLVAVPVGLMSAIYMSEYASDKCAASPSRCSKFWPAFPTIVYGLFALIAFGSVPA
jgi:phosphate transport system permease protein